jgi:predicted Zn-dependent protease
LIRFLTVLSLVATIALFGSGCKAPSFGNQLSGKQEALVGNEAAAELKTQYSVDDDPQICSKVNETTAKLVKVAFSPDEARQLQVHVLDSSATDAFSLPGGLIYIDSGLIQLVDKDPSALAAVIAHEMAHVKLHHAETAVVNAVGQDQLIEMLTEGKYLDAANVSIQLDTAPHSSDDERDADQLAVVWLRTAQFDPAGLIRVANLQPAGMKTDWEITHPVTRGRLRRLSQEVGS